MHRLMKCLPMISKKIRKIIESYIINLAFFLFGGLMIPGIIFSLYKL